MNMKLLVGSVVCAISLLGCVTTDIDGYSLDEMKAKTEAKTFIASNGVTIPYRLYVSELHCKSPLVVFLHGAGERGNDNEVQMNYGMNHIARFVDDNIEDAVIIAPQCPKDRYWKSEDMMTALRELVEENMNLGYVDKTKVYVTGYSMGGEGTWVFGLRNTDLITTLVPLCGGPLVNDPYDYDKVTSEMKGKNIWAFNYFDDPAVDNTYSKCVMSKVWSIETNNMHYTEGMVGGHTAEMYKSKKLMQWMFSTKKK